MHASRFCLSLGRIAPSDLSPPLARRGAAAAPRPITAQRMTTAIERWCAHMLR